MGYMQNYAVTTSGDTYAWGLKGFVLGTDELGRDILTRIINGGNDDHDRSAPSPLSSPPSSACVIGGLAGYFGGKVDMLLMPCRRDRGRPALLALRA